MKLEKNNKKIPLLFGKIGWLMMCLTVGMLSCNKSDDEPDEITPPRDRGEQQIIDNDSLIGYLESHYYNAADFVSNPDPKITELVITELAEGAVVPDGSTLLRTAVETKTVTYAGVLYDFYVLRLNQGGGDSPTFADDVRVLYEGSLLNGTVFDKNDVVPSYFDLIEEIAVEGWRRVIPLFNTAENFNETGDGTVNFVNKGVGVMFLPSGLAYYSNAATDIPAYSPMIFKFELLQMFQNDHDGDGIPSYLEDLNEDGQFTVNVENRDDAQDDDTDGDTIPDYADTDDDGDGVLTSEEIEVTTVNKLTRQEVLDTPLEANQLLVNKIIMEPNGSFTGTIITFTDTDSDGIPDYLDAE